MKVTIAFLDAELEDAVQQHLNGGVSVQNYIKAALRFFKDARSYESKGSAVGVGHVDSMKRYNRLLTTESYLHNCNEEPEL